MLHRLYNLLRRGEIRLPQLAFSTTEGYALVLATTVPADASAGYAVGCICVHLDGSGVTDLLYVNRGSNTSSKFRFVAVTTGSS